MGAPGDPLAPHLRWAAQQDPKATARVRTTLRRSPAARLTFGSHDVSTTSAGAVCSLPDSRRLCDYNRPSRADDRRVGRREAHATTHQEVWHEEGYADHTRGC